MGYFIFPKKQTKKQFRSYRVLVWIRLKKLFKSKYYLFRRGYSEQVILINNHYRKVNII